jgi:hypothetical protein
LESVSGRNKTLFAVGRIAVGFLLIIGRPLHADDAADWRRQMELLTQQNALLQQQVQRQEQTIEVLSNRVSAVEQSSTQHDQQLDNLKADVAGVQAAPKANRFNLGNVNLSVEGGVGVLSSQADGRYPNTDFRVNEARVYAEAPVWDDVYFFGEVDLATPENNSLNTQLGELYLDFENVSQLWGQDGMLNVRAGRMDIPFGEEYLRRNAIDNPLVLNSVSDLWGIDAGVELYGALGKFTYVTAVQNGGGNVPDGNGDKAVSGRLGYDPTRWLHVSVSGMRTGNLSVQNDVTSAMWFGNGFFKSIGSAGTTRFNVNLVEGDVDVNLSRGQIKMFGGYIHYDDNDPTGHNVRELYYYSVEGVADVTRKFYTVARLSQVFARNGYPVPGEGNFNEYFNQEQTTELWRLSIGAGYRFSKRLVIKVEYAFEHGKEVDGDHRNDEDFIGTEAAFKF